MLTQANGAMHTYSTESPTPIIFSLLHTPFWKAFLHSYLLGQEFIIMIQIWGYSSCLKKTGDINKSQLFEVSHVGSGKVLLPNYRNPEFIGSHKMYE